MLEAKTVTYGKGRRRTPDGNSGSKPVDSSGTMVIQKFIEAGSIDPIYHDESYYLAPDENGAEDVYAVLREAMARTGKVALAQVTSSGRQRTMVLRPMAGGLVAHTVVRELALNAADIYFKRIRVRLESVRQRASLRRSRIADAA